MQISIICLPVVSVICLESVALFYVALYLGLSVRFLSCRQFFTSCRSILLVGSCRSLVRPLILFLITSLELCNMSTKNLGLGECGMWKHRDITYSTNNYILKFIIRRVRGESTDTLFVWHAYLFCCEKSCQTTESEVDCWVTFNGFIGFNMQTGSRFSHSFQ